MKKDKMKVNKTAEQDIAARERKAYIEGYIAGQYSMAESGWDFDSDAIAREEARPIALRIYPDKRD